MATIDESKWVYEEVADCNYEQTWQASILCANNNMYKVGCLVDLKQGDETVDVDIMSEGEESDCNRAAACVEATCERQPSN